MVSSFELRARARAEARALRDAAERVKLAEWFQRQVDIHDEYVRALGQAVGDGAQKSAVPSGWHIVPGTQMLVRDGGDE